MKKILVTGGAGFIGSHASVSLFEKGFEPVIVDNLSNSDVKVVENIEKIVNKKVKFYEIDCCDKEELRRVFAENEFAGVIHFAAFKSVAESVKSPLKYYKNNIVSLVNVLELMNENNVRSLVFSSSCTVYGVPDKIPVDEESPIKPAFSPYGNTKQICEEIISDFCKFNDLNSVILRYFNPVGAHESSLIGELPLGVPENLVPFVTQSVAGIRGELTVFGNDYDTPDGTCIRDYIHVCDLADVHVKSLDFLEKNKGVEFFNVGTGKGVSVMELIKKFENVTGKKVNFKIGNRRGGDIPKIYADSSKAERVLNWKACRSIDDALVSAWKWQESIS